MIDQNYINHIAFVIDASGSMQTLESSVVKVADGQIDYLAQRSKELDQETRATIYTFNDRTDCIYYDKDVLRLPKLQSRYHAMGSTALIDATVQAIRDLKKTATLYGDHAFLIYVLTDGQENRSLNNPSVLKNELATLPANWTVAVLVPDQQGKFEAKKLGFAPDNIAIWETTARGITEVGETIRRATDSFMTGRAKGIRGTSSVFTIDTSNVDVTQLTKLHKLDFTWLHVHAASELQISRFVESAGLPYRLGSAFYQLTKPEDIQAQKQICVVDASGSVYSGAQARTMLGLPDTTVRVSPSNHPAYTVFVQSTSVNRKLVPGTRVLIIN